MYRLISSLCALILFAGLAAVPAAADDAATCRSARDAPDTVIDACTRMVQSGRLRGRDLAVAFVYRGIAHRKKGQATGQFGPAIVDFDRAIELDSRFAVAYNERGFTYGSNRQYDRAIQDYDKAIELDPRLLLAYSNRGLAYFTKGEPDRAIADYDKAIELAPRFASAYSSRGLAYVMTGQFDRAFQDLDKAIELDPRDPRTYINRGLAYRTKGDKEKASSEFQKALALDPSNRMIKGLLMGLGVGPPN